jgi:hypothetical protein
MRSTSNTTSTGSVGRAGGRRLAIRRAGLAAVVSFTTVSAAVARTHFFAVDVPVILGGTRYTPNLIIRSDDGVYSLAATLPEGTEILSLHARATGTWLFSPARSASLEGVIYEPRDIVSYDGANFIPFLAGRTAGIPDNARIDALFLDSSGNPVVSFDVPVNLAGIWYSQSDLLVYNGGFSLYWDAEGAGVPGRANVVGAARDSAGTLVLAFDVPTSLGGAWYLPGQLVGWDGTAFSSYATDPAWPPSAQLRDFSFLACNDSDGDGYGSPGDASCPNGSAGDCDDHNPAVYPGAPQVCDGVNNDCSDPTWPAVPANEADADHDGVRICNGDCDDTRAAVYPGAPQICDGVNDNCLDPSWPTVPSNEVDADGDGSPACADCDDANPAVFPGAAQLCDGVNNDCNDPQWPAVPPEERDADGDGISICQGDCNDSDSLIHLPGEVRNVGAVYDASTGGMTLSWDPPLDPGGPLASLQYDLLRSKSPGDFYLWGRCVATAVGDTSATDSDVPPAGQAFFYEVRALNVCYSGMGSLGVDSDGVARFGLEACAGYTGTPRADLFVNQGDATLSKTFTGSGPVIRSFGLKNADGSVAALTGAHVQSDGRVWAIDYDALSRPTLMENPEDGRVLITWVSATQVLLNVSTPGVVDSISVSLDLTNSTASVVPLTSRVGTQAPAVPDLPGGSGLPAASIVTAMTVQDATVSGSCSGTVHVERCGQPVSDARVTADSQTRNPVRSTVYLGQASPAGNGDYTYSVPCQRAANIQAIDAYCNAVADVYTQNCSGSSAIDSNDATAACSAVGSFAGSTHAGPELQGACLSALSANQAICAALFSSCLNMRAYDARVTRASSDIVDIDVRASGSDGSWSVSGHTVWTPSTDGSFVPLMNLEAPGGPWVDNFQVDPAVPACTMCVSAPPYVACQRQQYYVRFRVHCAPQGAQAVLTFDWGGFVSPEKHSYPLTTSDQEVVVLVPQSTYLAGVYTYALDLLGPPDPVTGAVSQLVPTQRVSFPCSP